MESFPNARPSDLTPRPSADRLPPYALEAEQGLLGCLLLDSPAVMAGCTEARLEPGWFYDLRHQHLWRSAAEILKSGQVVDTITLHQRIKDQGLLEGIGGLAYISSLQDSVPGAFAWASYLGIVRQKFLLRCAVQVAAALIEEAHAFDGDATAFLQQAEGRFATLSAPLNSQKEKHIREILPTVVKNLEDYHRGGAQMRGLPMGITYLDKLIRGIRPTDYVVVAGRPGDGKSALGMNIVEHLAVTLKIPVGVFSLEMDNESLVYRMIFSNSGADMGTFDSGYANLGDIQKLVASVPRLVNAPIWIDDSTDQTIAQVRSKARRMVHEHGIKLFVLDYLQLLDGDDERLRSDRVRELTRISKQIVSMKKEFKVPWLVLAQMNRNIEQAESKRVPVLSDLKDCGAIEQDADKILFLYRPGLKGREEEEGQLDDKFPEWSQRPARVNAFVGKNRFGPTGKAELLFWKNRTRFEDWNECQIRFGWRQASAGQTVKPREPEPEPLPTNDEMEL